MKICVIGAGVLGLSIAHELSADGHDVTVVEREHPFAGASHRSFAWINANSKFPSSYHRINAEGIEAHLALQERLSTGRRWMHRSGCLLVDHSEERPATYARRIEEAEAEGYPVRRVDADELSRLEPAAVWPEDVDGALLYSSEGYLDNDVFGEVLQAELARRGVEIEIAEAVRIDSDDSGAVLHLADGSSRSFDRVVVAAGAASGALAEASGFRIPVADLSQATVRTHSLLGLSRPTDVDLRHVLISDRFNVRPRHDGRLWVQVPEVEPRVAEGESPELLAEVAEVMAGELERLFGRPVEMEKVIFSGRSFPEDGHSIIGFVDEGEKVYCAVTHSGMTLAALFGALTAQELRGEESALLADFRPSRFDGGVARADDSYFIGKQ